MTLGSGEHIYEPVRGWAKIPEGWTLEVTDIAVDSRDRVYTFGRGIHPVVVFGRDGSFITSWGEGRFSWPHGITIGADDSVYVTDGHLHQVMKFTRDGKLLKTWGNKGAPGVTSRKEPFNLPTGVALAPSGEMFVSDGYGNSCVHKYDKSGEYALTWGEPGDGPGQFAVVHDVGVDSTGSVYVCDRENNRVQIFDSEGKFSAQWTDLRRPADIHIGREDTIYLLEQAIKGGGPPCRVSILTPDGKLLSSWDGTTGEGEESIKKTHGMGVDLRGDIYVTEDDFPWVKKFARKR